MCRDTLSFHEASIERSGGSEPANEEFSWIR